MHKLIVLVLLVLFTGCGGLSKGEAREQLEKFYAHDPNAYCTVTRSADEPEECGAAIKATAGEGPTTMNDDGNKLSIACGKVELGPITSISVEGDKAWVEYSLDVALDWRAKKLEDCLRKKPPSRMRAAFKRSDGKWVLK